MLKKLILIIGSLIIACSMFSESASAISDMQEAPQTKFKEEKLKKEVEKKKKAEEKKNTQYKAEEELQGGVKLKSTKYPYKQYRPVAYIDGGWNPVSSENLMKSVNLMADLIFQANIFISEKVDYFLSTWFDVKIIDKLVTPISELSSSIFNPMKQNLIPFIFTIGLMFAVGYFVMGRVGQTLGVIFKGVFIFGLALIWFSSQVYLINTMNDISEDGQSLFMSANEPLSDKKMQKDNEKQSTIAHIRNYYFETTVEKPYLLMNYGSVDKASIDKKKKNRVDELLQLKQNKEGNKKREEIAKKEVSDLKNSHMNSDSPNGKVVMGITTTVLNIMISIPLLAVALFDMFLQILIPLTMLFLPIVFALSMLPQLSMSIGKSFANLGMLFFLKMLVGILVTLTFTIINISEIITPIRSEGSYIANLLVTVLIYFVVFKFRNQLVSIVSGGAIQTKQRGRPGNNKQKFNPQQMLRDKQQQRIQKQSMKQKEISNINNELRQSETVSKPGNKSDSQEQIAKSSGGKSDENNTKQDEKPTTDKPGIKSSVSTVKQLFKKKDRNNGKSDNSKEVASNPDQVPNDLKSNKANTGKTSNTNTPELATTNNSNGGTKPGIASKPQSNTEKPVQVNKDWNTKELRGLQKDTLANNEEIKAKEKQYGSNPDFNRAKKDYAEYRKNHSKKETENKLATANQSPYYKEGVKQSKRLEKQKKNLETLVNNKDKVLNDHKSHHSDSTKETRVNRGSAYRNYIEKGSS